MTDATTLLFIYGSLKRGHVNHALLADQQFIGDAATTPHYRVYQLGYYGGLVRVDPDGLAVTGELWAVTLRCLATLDAFEQGEGLWHRRPVEVRGRDGVQSYLWTGEVPPDAPSGAAWPLPG